MTRLYPQPSEERPLEGLYLDAGVRGDQGRPTLYTNFVSGIDGCIAQKEPGSGRYRIPTLLANPHDIRLYHELAAQADAVLTTVAHVRAMAAGRRANAPLLSSHPDLVAWRKARGLPPEPVVAIITRTLEMPVSTLEAAGISEAVVFASRRVSPERAAVFQEAGVAVHRLGEERVDAKELYGRFSDLGWRAVYSICGPNVTGALLAAGIMQRFYLTLVNVFVADLQCKCLAHMGPLPAPLGLTLKELFYDPLEPPDRGQFFASYDVDG